MNKNHGFTLIELIVTVAVVSILLLTGIPALNNMTTSNRLTTQINEMAGSLALARSEAIKRGQSITLCGSNDGSTCNTSNWEDGWIVFTDPDNNAVLDSSSEIRLKIVDKLNGGNTLRLSQSDSASVIRYKSNGALRDLLNDGSLTDKGTFKICDQAASTSSAKAININTQGRISLADDTDSPKDGVVNDITGANITCP